MVGFAGSRTQVDRVQRRLTVAKRCARPGCGHRKSNHSPQSENTDAPFECLYCDCPEFVDEDGAPDDEEPQAA
jgi:hypothetical protein